ncbi:hypothetical protein [Chamaesiphon sp. OTE_20_metabat_361]|nr:hypothetical protein [Chamaesiphon sp. OTE_20_metabat_361]
MSTTDSDESISLRSIESDRIKVPCNYMELNKSLKELLKAILEH